MNNVSVWSVFFYCNNDKVVNNNRKNKLKINEAYIRFFTSTCIRRLFFSGYAAGGIGKMRSKFLQRRKRGAGAGTQPAG